MRVLALIAMLVGFQMASAQQMEFDFGLPYDVLKNTTFESTNINVSYDVPEEITKMWDERDFGFEIADGYYGYGPSSQYEIFDRDNNLIGYMLAQTLIYSEDNEYHVAYTVCDISGNTVIELEYIVYTYGQVEDIPWELRPSAEDE